MSQFLFLSKPSLLSEIAIKTSRDAWHCRLVLVGICKETQSNVPEMLGVVFVNGIWQRRQRKQEF
jgi:hypothetical protein